MLINPARFLGRILGGFQGPLANTKPRKRAPECHYRWLSRPFNTFHQNSIILQKGPPKNRKTKFFYQIDIADSENRTPDFKFRPGFSEKIERFNLDALSVPEALETTIRSLSVRSVVLAHRVFERNAKVAHPGSRIRDPDPGSGIPDRGIQDAALELRREKVDVLER